MNAPRVVINDVLHPGKAHSLPERSNNTRFKAPDRPRRTAITDLVFILDSLSGLISDSLVERSRFGMGVVDYL